MSLTKKQINTIATLWVGSMAMNVGTDSFEGLEMSNKDDDKIMARTHKIGEMILKSLPLMNTLEQMIEYAKNH